MATTVMMMMMTIVPSPSLISLHSTPITQLPLSPLHFTPFPKLPGQPWDLMTSMRLPWSAASLSSVPLDNCSAYRFLSTTRPDAPPGSPSSFITGRGADALFDLASFIFNGNIPESVRPWFLGGRLIALLKAW